MRSLTRRAILAEHPVIVILRASFASIEEPSPRMVAGNLALSAKAPLAYGDRWKMAIVER